MPASKDQHRKISIDRTPNYSLLFPNTILRLNFNSIPKEETQPSRIPRSFVVEFTGVYLERGLFSSKRDSDFLAGLNRDRLRPPFRYFLARDASSTRNYLFKQRPLPLTSGVDRRTARSPSALLFRFPRFCSCQCINRM